MTECVEDAVSVAAPTPLFTVEAISKLAITYGNWRPEF